MLREGVPSILCKFDMEKVYNHVDWDCIFYMLVSGRGGARGLDIPSLLLGFQCQLMVIYVVFSRVLVV